ELAQLPANIRLVACHELRVPELEGERHLLEFKHIQPE
ncbi:MAG: 16S rRNA (guanine(527)-N(7))-methyltransferase RsmG, partial [Aeromonas jandaei]